MDPTFKDRNVQNLFNLLSGYNVILVCFLLGNSPASQFHMPTFRNTVPSSEAGRYDEWLGLRNSLSNLVILHTYTPIKWNTECYETSAYTIQTPGNCPEESKQHSVEAKFWNQEFNTHQYFYTWKRRRYGDSQWAEWFLVRTPMGGERLTLLHGPETQQASCTMGTGVLSWE